MGCSVTQKRPITSSDDFTARGSRPRDRGKVIIGDETHL